MMGEKRGKATKIIKKTGQVLAWTLGFLVYIVVVLLFMLKNPKVQTVLSQRIALYLSEELQTKITISGVDVEFFKTIVLKGVYVGDRHNDTLLYAGKLKVDIHRFSYDNQYLSLTHIDLYNGTVKLKKYAGEKGLSYRFIAQYFKPTDTTTKHEGSPWKVELRNIGLHNITFIYRDTRDNEDDPGMDYEDIRVTGLFADVNDIDPMGDSLSFRIVDMRAKEQSGFTLSSFKTLMTVADTFARFDNLSFTTPGSKVDGFLSFQFHERDDIADDFIHKVKMDHHFSRSIIEMGDVAYFAPELLGIKKKVLLTGDLKGTVEHLRCKNVDLRFGEKSHVAGNFSFNGLPNIGETDMNFKIREAITNKKDLEGIPVAPFGPGDSLSIPANVGLLGDMVFAGSFEGFTHDFVAHGTLRTSIGTLELENLAMTRAADSLPFFYVGHVHSHAFNAGSYFSIPDMGTVTGHIEVNGSGFTNADINAKVSGAISQLQYRGYNYTGITITETALKRQAIEGDVAIDDPNLEMTFNGSIDNSGKIPRFDFHAQIDSANLGELGFMDKEHEYLLSGSVTMRNMKGSNIDNIEGSGLVDNVRYQKDGELFKFNSLSFAAGPTANGRRIFLTSDIAAAAIEGEFQMLKLQNTVADIMSDYLPAYFPPLNAKKKDELGRQQFSWSLQFHNNTKPLQALVPELEVAPGTYLHGGFNSVNREFDATFEKGSIKYAGITYRDIRIVAGNQGHKSYAELKGDIVRLQLNDTMGADSLHIELRASNNDVLTSFKWDNQTKKANDGLVVALIHFENEKSFVMNVQKTELHVNDSAWSVVQGNSMRVDSNHVTFNNLVFKSGEQSIGFNGVVSPNPHDQVMINLKKFNIAYLNYFTEPNGVTLQGVITSETSFTDPFNAPIFTSTTTFDSLYINKYYLGDGNLSAVWFPPKDAVRLDGSFTRGIIEENIGFHGFYYPKKKENSLDIDAKVEGMDLGILQTLLADYCSKLIGTVTGNVHVAGTPAKPLINGTLMVGLKMAKVDYLGLSLNAPVQPITIEENSFAFDDFKVSDGQNDTATIYGHLYHTNFSNFQFDMDFAFDHFMLINTTAAQNEAYYGKVYGTGFMNISGFVDSKVMIDMDVTTNKVVKNGQTVYSEFNIPMSTTSEEGSTDFITFVDPDKKDSAGGKTLKSNGVELHLMVHATEDAYVKVIFDKTVGDELTAYGNGDIKMDITQTGDMSLEGQYTVTSGKYLFTMKNIVYVPFDLARGGTISWNGDPYEAQIDADALYRTSASVEPFFLLDSTNPALHRNYPVDVVMHLDGALMNPGVAFDINLPTADQNIQETVKSYTQTELERNKQVLSLMVLNSFITPSELRTGSATDNPQYENAGSTVLSNFVSGTLNNWLSQISTDLDMKVVYRPTDDPTAQDLKVYLGYQMLNNRMTIESNFGKMNASEAQTAENSTQWVGDVNVEYKVTPDGKVRLRAFNRSNENTVLNTSASPYTQGVGIFYREEFESGQELKNRMREYLMGENPNRKKKDPQPSTPPPTDVPQQPADSTTVQ